MTYEEGDDSSGGGLQGIFGDKKDRERRRRARKTGGGGVKGNCKPGKNCSLPFKDTTSRKKIKKIKVRKEEEEGEEWDSVGSWINPRNLHDKQPDAQKNVPFLKRVFGKKNRTKGLFE